MKVKTSKNILYCFLLIPILSYPIFAQQNETMVIDSLLNELENVTADTSQFKIYGRLFQMHYRKDIPKAKLYLDEELRLADRINTDESFAQSKNHEGIYYSIIRDNEKALEIFSELKAHYESTGNEERLSSMLQNMASALLGLGMHKLALESQMESLKLSEKLGQNGVSMAHNYFTIGNIHRMINNTEVSNEWVKKARNIYKKENALEYEAQAIYTLGINYLYMDSLEKAEPYFKEAELFFRETKNPNSLSVVLNGLAVCSQARNDFKLAIQQLEESLALGKSNGDIARATESYSKIGDLYSKLKDYPRAIYNHQKSLEGTRKIKNREIENTILHRLAIAYGNNKDYKIAYETLTESNILKDSIQKEDNLAALSELEIKYQTEKKEQEIQLLNEKTARKDLQNTLLFGGLLALIAIIVAMFYAFKQRAKLNKIAKEKLEQELDFSLKELNIKKQELTAYALQLANKNEMLQTIKSRVEEIKSEENKNKALQSISNSIHLNQNDDATWEGFRERFLAVHKDFDTKVLNTFPEITKNDLRLLALIRMSLSSKEIANILNISSEGVKKARYRLRKKLNLESVDSLEEFIIGF